MYAPLETKIARSPRARNLWYNDPMPRQNTQLANNEIYHICFRAVGDSVIFKDDNDHFRGIFSIYEFNNSNFVNIWTRRRDRLVEKKKEKVSALREHSLYDKRDCFVEVLVFCFMPNHIHLLVRQLKDGGISRFMQKLGGGYAQYFNNKYQRKGHLFNQFKAIHISSNKQLKNVMTYIHCNPISIIEPGWKEKGVKNYKMVKQFLEKKYRWSSLFDYLGKNNFPSTTQRDFILKLMDGPEGIRQDLDNWIKYNRVEKLNYAEFER